MSSAVEISVLLLAIDEAGNIGKVISGTRQILERHGISYEFIVIDGGSQDGTVQEATVAGARCLQQRERGYGAALRQGLSQCDGDFIMCLDSDGSHPPALTEEFLLRRNEWDLIIGSRFIPGGSSEARPLRRELSRILNKAYRSVLDLPVTDFSSGFRLYRRNILRIPEYRAYRFDILPEILIRAFADGYRVTELPLAYKERSSGRSHARLISFGLAYAATLFRMWRYRNSIAAADYDHRAHDSRIPLQRWWQRMRHGHILAFTDRTKSVLDIGCGSSHIIQDLPHGVALDFAINKLRFLRGKVKSRVRASTFALPFRDHSFEQVIHSQVIEHIPMDDVIFTELHRVLQPGGNLVIGTPDYGRPWWPIIEFFYGLLLPNAYADEHISHYTFDSLTKKLSDYGFRVEEHRYILGGELIIRATRI